MPDTFVSMPEGWDNVWWCWLCNTRACPVPPLTVTGAVIRHLAEVHPTPKPEEAPMTDTSTYDKHRDTAARIVGSMPDTALQQQLIEDIAKKLDATEQRAWNQGMAAMAPGKVRVVRVLEYLYPDAKSALDDQQNWQVQGVYRPSAGRLIRSTVLPMEVLD